MKKYELLENDTIEIADSYKQNLNHKLFRIKAVRNFGNVKVGDMGGYIEKEENLSHDDNAWVFNNAMVYGNAKVYHNAKVYGDAKVCNDAKVFGNAAVYDNAIVFSSTAIYGNAEVFGNAKVFNNARVYDDAWIYGDAIIFGNAKVFNNARVYDNAEVYNDAMIYSDSNIYGNAKIFGDVAISNSICGTAKICDEKDYAVIKGIKGFGTEQRTIVFFRCSDGNIRVKCSFFYGTIPEFRERVKNTRTGKFAAESLKIADLMEYHFSEEDINLPSGGTCMTKD